MRSWTRAALARRKTQVLFSGKRIHKAFASAITGLLRQNRLERDGSQIRKAH